MTTVTGTYIRADGTPASGYIRFTPMPSGLLGTGEQVVCQPVYAMLDTTGSFAVDLVPDDAYVNITGDAVYEIAEFITDCHRCWYLFLSDDSPVDLPSRYPGDDYAASAAVLPVPGPQGETGATGPQGPQGPQGDPGAPVTVQDAATGRLQIAGVEMGSTGWRLLTPENGWTGTGIRAARTGSTVSLSLYNVPGSAAVSDTLVTLPSGFRPGNGQAGLWVFSGSGSTYSGAPSLLLSIHRNTGVVNTTNRGNVYAMTTYYTSEPWPTSLPGTPA